MRQPPPREPADLAILESIMGPEGEEPEKPPVSMGEDPESASGSDPMAILNGLRADIEKLAAMLG
jgi:hypothetical protein